MNLYPYLSPYTKKDSKWIKDLNVRTKTIKLLEGNIGINHHDLGLGNGFLTMTPKAQATKEKINTLDFIKTEKFGHRRTLSIKQKDNPEN